MRLLLLTPTQHFNIVRAELVQTAYEGEYMDVKAVRLNECSNDAERDLYRLCDSMRDEQIYRHVDHKTYRRMADLWANAESSVKKYLKGIADRALQKAITLASGQDIPIIWRETEKAHVAMSNRLTLAPDGLVKLQMHFRREPDHTIYQLRLLMGSSTIVPSGHRCIPLCHTPGVIAVDGTIYFLADGVGGQLLQPFVGKREVLIPRKLENQYFHNFILRNAAKVNIEAEGFDVIDEKIAPHCELRVVSDVRGSWVLEENFVYGDLSFHASDPNNGRVELVDKDGNYAFIRRLRDKPEEAAWHIRLHELTGVSTQGHELLFSDTNALVDWLRRYAHVLADAGFIIEQPSDKTYYIGKYDIREQTSVQGDWLQLHVDVCLDDGRHFPFSQLRATILSGSREYRLPTGELLIIPEEWLARYGTLLFVGEQKGDVLRIHRTQSAALPETKGWWPATEVVTLPRKLRAQLRPYQQKGYEWLWRNFDARTGCCLADEMGLGKTLQTIALLLKYKEVSKARKPKAKPADGLLFTWEEMTGQSAEPFSCVPAPPFRTSLILAPSSVVYNWREEIARFAPSLMVCEYTGTPEQRRRKRETLMRWDVVITSYQTMARDIEHLKDLQLGILVADECQAFKNSSSQVYQAICQLQCLHHVALSGTPVEDNLMELWSLMSVLNPQLLGSAAAFRHRFSDPITTTLEERRSQLLRQMIAPYFLKRTKEEVLTDLPPRQDKAIYCEMTESQAERYAIALSQARNEYLQAEGKMTELRILNVIQQLRQIANGEGKTEEVMRRLEELRGTHHRVLLFSEYVSFLDRLAEEMRQRGWAYEMLTGQTRDRGTVVERFQQGSAQFFLISLKAGGTGLNITGADYIFLLDPWWNRSPEEQAIGRAHRIGQQRPVFVYRFVTLHTLEPGIVALQDRKQSVIDAVMPFARQLFEGSDA